MKAVTLPPGFPVRLAGALILAVLGLFGNLLAVDLFFSIDFLLGGIFAMLALLVLGPGWGIAVAAVASLATYSLWQHPYAIVVFTAEAVFVGLLLRRRAAWLFTLDILYWVSLGAAQIFLFYHLVMGIDLQGTVLIALKQGVNGIFNAFVAVVLVLMLQLLYKRRRRPLLGRHHLRAMLQLLVVGFVLIPLLLEVVVTGRDEFSSIENEIAARVQYQLRGSRVLLEQNILSRERQLQRFSRQLHEDFELSQGDQADSAAEWFLAVHSDFVRLEIESAAGYIGGAERSAAGEQPTIGITAGLESPEGQVYRLTGYMQPERIMPAQLPGADGSGLLLLDAHGRVLGSVGDELPEELAARAAGKAGNPGQHLLAPALAPNVSVMDRWRSSYFAAVEPVGQDISTPMYALFYIAAEGYRNRLYASYIRLFSMLAGLLLLSILLASAITQRFFRSLRAINAVARDLPARIAADQEVSWPSSIILEFEEISDNFHQAGSKIRTMFQQQRQLNRELEEARQAAEASSRAKSEFIAGMSHELRTPLNAILGYAQLLRRSESSAEDLDEIGRVISSSGQHLLRLINDILQYAGSNIEEMPLEYRLIHIHDLVKDLELMFQVKARQKGVELITRVDPAIRMQVHLPERAVTQILVNLLNNALQHAASGRVELSAEKLTDGLLFRVHDTGNGIPVEEQERVFQPFYQIGAVQTKHDGIGLGLAICRRLARAFGSDIELVSTPGEGTEFSFRVPLQQPTAAGAAAGGQLPEWLRIALLEEARKGDIAGIEALLEQHVATDPHLQDFSRQVKRLLDSFAVDELVELLQPPTSG
ncbi:ATP-binding protein [Spirochaeta africana]|uniref:histidine kinase n=1 Tax=Spirochaeta africana (strain ATCC 700263 / DSM 8902 / Z-7692) TaxID=889378 RepID=H9UFM2_SPIAZ|nr:ATP-binding protein [Spirochaeta africana]AFG36315.1 signal transduction histidine kinase [Spirochaeta africana DSM 8902]